MNLDSKCNMPKSPIQIRKLKGKTGSFPLPSRSEPSFFLFVPQKKRGGKEGNCSQVKVTIQQNKPRVRFFKSQFGKFMNYPES